MYKVADFSDLHTELKLPEEVAADVREWVDKLDWPKGSKKEDRRNYHITILSIDNDCEDFREWMTEEMKGKTFDFESTGLDLFNECVVLKLDSDQWKNLAVAWGKRAYDRGLEPRRFPGGPKAHITVGFLGEEERKPRGIQNPSLKFTTGEFNINKNAAVADWGPIRVEPQESNLIDQKSGLVRCPSGHLAVKSTEYRPVGPAPPPRVICPECRTETVFGKDGQIETVVPIDNHAAEIYAELVQNVLQHNSDKFARTASDLKQWLDSIETPAPQPLSPYHDSLDDFMVQPVETGPGIPSPDFKPDPYLWQDDQRVEYPEINRTSGVSRQRLLDDAIKHKKELTDYEKAKQHWYDEAWSKNPIPEEETASQAQPMQDNG